MLRLSLIMALAIGLPTGELCGQAVPREGDWVRITRADGSVVSGHVQSASPQEVVLRPVIGEPTPVVSAAQIALMERDAGTYTRFWRNFGIAYGAAVLLTGTAVALTWKPCHTWCSQFDADRGSATVFYGGLIGSLFGLMAGTVAGTAIRYERWEALSLPGPDRATFSIHPVVRRDVFGVSASLTLGR